MMPFQSFNLPQKLNIARQIALGLTYIHSLAPKLIHRDLKCRNVLLNTQMEAKLTGFSVARELLDEEDTTTGSSKLISHVGSGLWMAPELIIGKKVLRKGGYVLIWDCHQCLSLDPDKRPTTMEVCFKLMKMIKSLAQ